MPLEIYLLGPPRFELEGERLYLSRRKSIALLAYLVATGQPQTRDALAALLWPEFGESTARTNLRRDLSWLRRLLPEEVLWVDRLQVDLNLAADVWLDVQQLPMLTLLITSRERLRLQEEQLYPLSGLDIPTADMPEAAAGELFLSSAWRVRPNFVPTEAEQADIFRICQIVEGMPLALELAGSWIDTLSPRGIGDEIARNLDFLETELINVPRRHRSVRAAIDGSWQKLSPEQQRQLARLSTLRGSFTREAAEAVAGVSLRTLTHLINKSFVGFQPQTKRYDIHALILQFAASQLAQNPTEKERSEAAHACYFIAIGQALSATDVQALALFEWGHALWRLSQFEECREKLNEALMLAREAQLVYLEADVLRLLGLIDFNRGENDAAEQMFTTALALFRECKALQGEALTVNNLGLVKAVRKQMRQAVDLFKESRTLHHQIKDRAGEARALTNLANIESDLGQIVPAIQHTKQALAMHLETGIRLGEAVNLGWLGKMYRDLGQYDTARCYLQQGVALCQQIGARQDEINLLLKSSQLELQSGDYRTAYQLEQQGLALAYEFEVMRQIPTAMNCCGHALHGLGEWIAAQEAYQDALKWLQDEDQAKERTEPQAGLARLRLEQGEVEKALSHIEPILCLIAERPLSGIFGAFGIYLTCYEVLQAAVDRLETQAQQIYDYTLRASFLQNVPAHQALLAAL